MTSILADVHQQTKSAFGVKWIWWADAKAKGEEARLAIEVESKAKAEEV